MHRDIFGPWKLRGSFSLCEMAGPEPHFGTLLYRITRSQPICKGLTSGQGLASPKKNISVSLCIFSSILRTLTVQNQNSNQVKFQPILNFCCKICISVCIRKMSTSCSNHTLLNSPVSRLSLNYSISLWSTFPPPQSAIKHGGKTT